MNMTENGILSPTNKQRQRYFQRYYRRGLSFILLFIAIYVYLQKKISLTNQALLGRNNEDAFWQPPELNKGVANNDEPSLPFQEKADSSEQQKLRENNDQDSSITIWSRYPIPNQHSMIVTKVHSQKSFRAIGKFYQVIGEVQFKQCITDKTFKSKALNATSIEYERCPKYLEDNIERNNMSLSALKEWNDSTSIALFIHKSTTSNIFQLPSKQSFFAITYYDSIANKHIPFLYESVFRKGLMDNERFTIIPCSKDGSKGKKYCPIDCSRIQSLPASEHPYYFDIKDGLCKSQNPIVVKRYGGVCNCESTCYTPNAVVDTPEASVWPWPSIEMKNQFYTNEDTYNSTIQRQHGKFVRQSAHSRFLSPEYSTYKARFDCTLVNNQTKILKLGSHNYTKTIPNGIYGSFNHHLYFIPQAKLLFCGVPKVGITQWLEFIRYALGANDYLSLPHYKKDTSEFMVQSLSIEKATELIMDPTWTKAVFFRNPAERLLSAFLDKIAHGGPRVPKVFGINQNNKHRTVENFDKFVNILMKSSNLLKLKQKPCKDQEFGLHSCTDPHWRPQLMICGLDYLLPYFDFIGDFAHISNQTKQLLDRVGIWNNIGENFDNEPQAAGDTCSLLSRSAYEKINNASATATTTRQIYGFNQRGPSNIYHSTSSNQKMEKFYTPELLTKVRKAYALDYAIYDELQKHYELYGDDNIIKGKDMNIVQSYCKNNEEIIEKE